MPNDPLLSMLGIARKAGKLSVGTEAAHEAVKKRKSHLVVVAADISQKSEKELRYAARETNIPVRRIQQDIFAVSHAIGTKAGILSVDDKGLAEAVLARCRDNGEEFAYDD
ncbi:MAG: L7Ae/L30e/S12e/Gadd45 family ribosomal protein [Candidatus Howiella sp.]|jgi:ribosomal protein L7Ae-like RNA K-turn-binding protein